MPKKKKSRKFSGSLYGDAMVCKKCGAELIDGAAFCHVCGRPLIHKQAVKHRGNGQGSVYQLPNGKYKAVVILGYYKGDDGKKRKKTRSKVFDKKKDAIASISDLQKAQKVETKRAITFKKLYDEWLPTHRAGKQTLDCYKAAIKYFEPVWSMRVQDIDVDDLQECIDDCPHGKRTKQNMKAVCGLVYKYGIPRHVIPENLNLATYLHVDGDSAAHREAFSAEQIEKIKKACGKVPHAEDIYCMIYLGFRPSEFLSLTADSYDSARDCLVGGAKTQAGKGRAVTISPKIKSLISHRVASGGYLFSNGGKQWPLKDWTEDAFYPALDAIGIDNPVVEIAGGKKRHQYTPHSCRHTFATLLKRVSGSDKDKQELIGHASAEMLRYYQDAPVDDLKRITDMI